MGDSRKARIRTKLRVKEADDIIRRRNRELSILPEIGKELSARPDVQDLSNVLLKHTVETLGAFEGYVVLIHRDGTYQKGFHFAPATSKTLLVIPEDPFTNFLYQHVKETRQSLIIDDTQKDPRWISRPNDPIHSAIAVPLFGRRELLGLITLTHELEKYFTLDHILLLQ